MTSWDDRVRDHAYPSALTQLADEIAAAETPATAHGVESLVRLGKVVGHLRTLLDGADNELLTPAMLDRALGSVQQATTEVRAYKQTGDVGHCDSANGHADAALDATAGWPLLVSAEQVANIGEAAASFRRSVGQLLRGMQSEESETRQELARTAEGLSAAEAKFQAAERALTERLSAIATDADVLKGRIDGVVGDFQSQFSTAQEDRRKEFDAANTELRKQASDELKKHLDEASDAVRRRTEESDKVVAEIGDLRDEAAKLVGVIGSTGMTGGFKSYADTQRTSAFWWAAAGVVLPLVVIAGVAAWLLNDARGGAISFDVVAAKAFISVPLAALSGYSAQQSAKHRRNERGARKLELELASLGAFMADLTTDDQHAMKKQVAERVFGHPDTTEADDKVGAQHLAELLAQAIKGLAK